MIAQLTGEVANKMLDAIVLDVNGVGYEILAPNNVIDECSLGDKLTVFTHHHIGETANSLYGFTQTEAKSLFQQLLSVNGVGPKAGLAIMSLGDSATIKNSIVSNDIAFITSASGIGKKGAEKIVLELKDKVDGTINVGGETANANIPVADDALQALLALGYTQQQALVALAKLDKNLSTEEKVKLALKEI